jgi:hypothetical protein
MLNPLNNANSSVSMNERALLAYRVMSIPSYQGTILFYFILFYFILCIFIFLYNRGFIKITIATERFKEYYVEFLNDCFSPKLQNATIHRIASLESFLMPVIKVY